ncbi:MAG: transposase family protein [Pirellula sp.]
MGVRATKPNEIWHVDTTLIRLVGGAKVYVHAVIDNYSRRILAWQAKTTYDTSTTAKLLVEVAKGLKGVVPKVYMDSGVENLNTHVDALVASGTIQRIIAQVLFSNSMIESWWRMLKHGIRHSRDRPPMKCTSVKGAIYQTSSTKFAPLPDKQD